MPNKILLSLGSNIGDKKGYLLAAQKLIIREKKINLLSASSYYRSEPIGFTEQDWFVNNCLLIESEVNPEKLLLILKKIEKSLGRKPRQRWHEREIDIDIVIYDNLIFQSKALTIPHPEMHKRSFVLIPGSEIAPKMLHPVIGKTLEELAKLHQNSKEIQRLTK